VGSRERALTLLCRGINLFFGRKVAADKSLLEAASVAREVGDEWTEAYACGHLALWLIDDGQSQHAAGHLATVERLAEARDDEMLKGLAGLARGWRYLAEEDVDKALGALRAVRHLSADSHQHHFIGMYIALALYRRDDLSGAALEWLDAMRNAIAVRHMRGIAGTLEGCAYIAVRLGDPQAACRFLSAAEQIRQRAGSPLFSFWYRHNAAAHSALRTALGSERYEAAIRAGMRKRTEDVVNEAGEQLRRFGEGCIR
jgi:hypothetical protein